MNINTILKSKLSEYLKLKYNIDFNEVNIDIDYNKREEMVIKTNGQTSVPQIFIGSKHIGGCDDLHELEKENKLAIFNN